LHTIKLNTDQVKKILSLLVADVTYSESYGVIRSSLALIDKIADESGVAPE
jgi:hypothetical protein